MPQDDAEKKITVTEVKASGASETRVEAPKAKVKAAAIGLTPDDVERMIKEKQKEKK